MESLNPATGESIQTYPEMTREEVDAILEKADAAYQDWRHTSFLQRSSLMKKAGEILRARKEEFARLMALEMGKPVAQGRGEVEKCAWVCDDDEQKTRSPFWNRKLWPRMRPGVSWRFSRSALCWR